MTTAERYMHHRAESSRAFRMGDGAMSSAHARAAHAALVEYATAHGITTDDAAARIRQEHERNARRR